MSDVLNYFRDSSKVILNLEKHTDIIQKMAEDIYKLKVSDNKILIAGNGGSCADAEHFAGELVCTFKDRQRIGISGISLSNNSSAITAWANDFSFESYFERQVESIGCKGDILFLITTGGGNRENGASMNLVIAAEKAREKGMKIFTIAGKGGGILKTFSDLSVVVESDITSQIQEGHIAIIHLICLYLDQIDQRKRA
tara:strand:- start:46 stop:639 length:594 start_codon:yes stop_codon:yes gene_type:complete